MLPLPWCPDTEKTCPMCPPQRFCDLCSLQTEKKRRLKKVSKWLENKKHFFGQLVVQPSLENILYFSFFVSSYDFLYYKKYTRKKVISRLKGLCHKMNIFLKDYNNKQVLSVHALKVFKIICFLVDEKSNSKFYLASLKLVTNFENTSSSLSKTLKRLFLALIMLTGSRL